MFGLDEAQPLTLLQGVYPADLGVCPHKGLADNEDYGDEADEGDESEKGQKDIPEEFEVGEAGEVVLDKGEDCDDDEFTH